MYEQGEGIPQDVREAAIWYRKAADQGDAVGEFNLGTMYDRGEGVPQNRQTAAELYRKSANQ